MTPVDPGYATWSIAPHPGHLAWAAGTVPTPHGDITTHWWSTGPIFTLDTETPARTSGVVALPATERSLVLVDGRIVCRHGTCTGFHGHIDNGTAHLTLPGGRHTVIVTRG